ncbi:hypothetical protein ARAM_001285 [Aspergillus rambellii]|uniref:G-patch domain-containing protein n=1 Tax=Aspergillus rambellii TaxID=308745 RepID=A0A0F8VV96_9EURO|nr:hypothetical protein ARAM_001285 [Aspergillus rambellii]
MSKDSNPYEDEDYFLPLEDQRVFGAGITRKRVPFVRSSEHELTTLALSSSTPNTTPFAGSSIANRYLSIVMPKSSSSCSPNPSTSTAIAINAPESIPASANTDERSHSAPPPPTDNPLLPSTCEICDLPLANTDSNPSVKPHEASLAHQVCLSHSHPPSHLDRTRHGLRYLASYGWDPDSRVGLGAPGREGIREPLKGKLKADTVGLGANVPTEEPGKTKTKTKDKDKDKDKVQKLNAKQVRKAHVQARKRGEKLREMFYRDENVLKYLGDG